MRAMRGVCYAAALMSVAAGVVCAQTYPSKPVRIIVTGVGGGGDVTARLIAPGLATLLGQQVVVDNRNDGSVAAETVTRAAADGHTVLLNSSNVWLEQFLRDNVPWDPVRDLSPVTIVVSAPNLLVVTPTLAVKSAAELIALAKARPGALNYATTGSGNTNHIAGELFKALAGINLVRVNYKGTTVAMTDLVGGQVQVMFPTAGAGMSYVKSGRLKALAVTSTQPSALAPELPTVAATGLPGYESVAVFGMFAPAKTPDAVIMRLNRDVVRALNQPEARQKLFSAGNEVVGSSPEQLMAVMKSDMTRLGKLIKDAGIRDD